MTQIIYGFLWVGGNNDFKAEKMTCWPEKRINLWDLESNPLKWHKNTHNNFLNQYFDS